MKLNFIKVKDGMMRWRQIEQTHGLTFMRYKQRRIRVYRKHDMGAQAQV